MKFYDFTVDQIHQIHPPIPEGEFQEENSNLLVKSIEIYKQFLFGFEHLFESGLPKLREELMKKKVFHEEFNAKKIYDLLKEEKDRRATQHESMLDSIELPLPSDQLELRISEIRDDVITRFNKFSEKYRRGKSYNENLPLLEVIRN